MLWLPPSSLMDQEAKTDNIKTVGKEASQMQDVIPKLHCVSQHPPGFMKADGINGLTLEEGFASFHPSMNAIHREQNA
jgi:hypothetical protein